MTTLKVTAAISAIAAVVEAGRENFDYSILIGVVSSALIVAYKVISRFKKEADISMKDLLKEIREDHDLIDRLETRTHELSKENVKLREEIIKCEAGRAQQEARIKDLERIVGLGTT